jgi:hypothetical protein
VSVWSIRKGTAHTFFLHCGGGFVLATYLKNIGGFYATSELVTGVIAPPLLLPFCLPLPFCLSWVDDPSDPLDLELRAALSAFRLPGETERLFDALPTVESDPDLPVAFVVVAAAAAIRAAVAASQCDDKAGVDRLLGSVTLLVAVLVRLGRAKLASSSSESDTMHPKTNQYSG